MYILVGKVISEENERECVEKLFTDCEEEGFSRTFFTPYSDHSDRIGQPFSIARRLEEEDADLECLPMWKIRFEDGTEIDAYPEEIIPSQIASVKEQMGLK